MKELKDLQEKMSKVFKLKPEQSILLLNQLPIREDARFTKAKRIAVYQNGYIARMTESLTDDFPKTFKYIKKEDRKKMVDAFLTKYPSRYKSIASVSENFPIFVKQKMKHKKFLADLSEMEWMECLSSYSIQQEPFDFTKLKLKSPEDIFGYKMKLSGTLYLFKSSWTVHTSKIKRATTYLAIFRNKEGLHTEPLTLEQFNIFGMLKKGHSILSLLRRKEKISQKNIFVVFEFLSKHQLIVNLSK